MNREMNVYVDRNLRHELLEAAFPEEILEVFETYMCFLEANDSYMQTQGEELVMILMALQRTIEANSNSEWLT